MDAMLLRWTLPRAGASGRSQLHGGTPKDQSAKIDVLWMFCINLVCLLCVVKQTDR